MIWRVMEMGWSFWRWRRLEDEDMTLGGTLNQESVVNFFPPISTEEGAVCEAEDAVLCELKSICRELLDEVSYQMNTSCNSSNTWR